MRYFVTFPTGEELPVEVDHLPTGELSVVVNGRRLAADAVMLDGTTSIGIDRRIGDDPGRTFHDHPMRDQRDHALSAGLACRARGA